MIRTRSRCARIVPHLAAFQFDAHRSNGAAPRTAVVAVIDQQLKAAARASERYRRRLERWRAAAVHQRIAATDEAVALALDVRQAVATLPPRERVVCEALSNGATLSPRLPGPCHPSGRPIWPATWPRRSCRRGRRCSRAGRRCRLEGVTRLDEGAIDRAGALFDLAQHAADVWRGSNSATRREILDAVSLNRTLSDATLCIQKRKPFDVLAEGPFLEKSRGDRI